MNLIKRIFHRSPIFAPALLVTCIGGAVWASYPSVRENSAGSEYNRRRLNFIEGAGISVGLADDAVNNETDVTLSVTASGVDHGGLAGLADDDHAQYALLAGRAAGQTLTGGTGAGDDLTIRTSSHATKGSLLVGSSGTELVVDDVNDRVASGTASPEGVLHLRKDSAGSKSTLLILHNRSSTASSEAELSFIASGTDYSTDRRVTISGVNVDGSTGVDMVFRTSNGAAPAEAMRIKAAGDVTFAASAKSTSATGGIGYATGAGCAVTQITSKSTGVTCNGLSGEITMNNAALAAGAEVVFAVTNSAAAIKDVIIVNHVQTGTTSGYLVGIANVSAGGGAFQIIVSNVSAGSLSEALVVRFAIIKAVTS
jgi:hypothetical protein